MENPLKIYINLFFSNKGDSVLGIDIGSSAIKLVQLRKKGVRPYLRLTAKYRSDLMPVLK